MEESWATASGRLGGVFKSEKELALSRAQGKVFQAEGTESDKVPCPLLPSLMLEGLC